MIIESVKAMDASFRRLVSSANRLNPMGFNDLVN